MPDFRVWLLKVVVPCVPGRERCGRRGVDATRDCWSPNSHARRPFIRNDSLIFRALILDEWVGATRGAKQLRNLLRPGKEFLFHNTNLEFVGFQISGSSSEIWGRYS